MAYTYTTIGILIVIFVLQLIILLYIVWVYNQFICNMNDCEDLLVSIYTIELAELKGEAISDLNLEIPKRIRERINKINRHEKK